MSAINWVGFGLSFLAGVMATFCHPFGLALGAVVIAQFGSWFSNIKVKNQKGW